jgi:hypothetical protein
VTVSCLLACTNAACFLASVAFVTLLPGVCLFVCLLACLFVCLLACLFGCLVVWLLVRAQCWLSALQAKGQLQSCTTLLLLTLAAGWQLGCSNTDLLLAFCSLFACLGGGRLHAGGSVLSPGGLRSQNVVMLALSLEFESVQCETIARMIVSCPQREQAVAASQQLSQPATSERASDTATRIQNSRKGSIKMATRRRNDRATPCTEGSINTLST